jgi:hypothetical protein
MDRRTFLAQTAAVPLIFGLPLLFGQEPAPGMPEWYEAALKRMKELGRYGVAIVAPDLLAVADPTQADAPRRRLGTTLWTLAHEEYPAAHALFSEAVFICLTSDIADRTVRKAGDARNRFLLSPDGDLLSADKVDAAAMENLELFVSSFAPFLHGEGNSRLKERSEAIQKRFDAEVEKAFSQLGADSADDRESATAILSRRAESLTPYLAWLSISAPDFEKRGRAKDLLAAYYTAGPRLPYGSYLPEVLDSCRGCGMGRVPENSRKFIRFLLK